MFQYIHVCLAFNRGSMRVISAADLYLEGLYTDMRYILLYLALDRYIRSNVSVSVKYRSSSKTIVFAIFPQEISFSLGLNPSKKLNRLDYFHSNFP